MYIYKIERKTYLKKSKPSLYANKNEAVCSILVSIRQWCNDKDTTLDYNKIVGKFNEVSHRWTVRRKPTGEHYCTMELHQVWVDEATPEARCYPEDMLLLANQINFNE